MEVKCLHLQVRMKLSVLVSVFSLHFRNKKIWLPTQVHNLLLHHPLKHKGTASFMSVRPDSAPVGPNFRHRFGNNVGSPKVTESVTGRVRKKTEQPGGLPVPCRAIAWWEQATKPSHLHCSALCFYVSYLFCNQILFPRLGVGIHKGSKIFVRTDCKKCSPNGRDTCVGAEESSCAMAQYGPLRYVSATHNDLHTVVTLSTAVTALPLGHTAIRMPVSSSNGGVEANNFCKWMGWDPPTNTFLNTVRATVRTEGFKRSWRNVLQLLFKAAWWALHCGPWAPLPQVWGVFPAGNAPSWFTCRLHYFNTRKAEFMLSITFSKPLYVIWEKG